MGGSPLWRRAALALYVWPLRLYFRWLKVPLSRIANRFKPKASWPHLTWASLGDFDRWLRDHATWTSDPAGGALDLFPSREHLAWQLNQFGRVADDCDGLACFSAGFVHQFCERPEEVYIVTVVLDPFSFPEKPLFYAAHVICIFRCPDGWRVTSNQFVDPQCYESFETAVTDNTYTRGHPLLFCEVRDADLHFIANGDLRRVRRILERRGYRSDKPSPLS